MKRLILVSIALLLIAATHVLAQGPAEPAGPSSKGATTTGPASLGPAPAPGPGAQEDKPPAEVFFADGVVSPDGKYLYVILDRLLYQYSLPSLELGQKVELGIKTAPVTPSISISKDSKHIYIISNGTLYQIDGATLKILNQKKLTR